MASSPPSLRLPLLQPHHELQARVRDPHEGLEERVEDPWELRLAHLDPMGLDFESVERGVSPKGLHRELVQGETECASGSGW